MIDHLLHPRRTRADRRAARGHALDQRQRHAFVVRREHADLVLHQQPGHVFVVPQKFDLVGQLQLLAELARVLLRAGLATAGELDRRLVATLAQQGDRLEQRGVVLLSRKPRGHDNARDAFAPWVFCRTGKWRGANAVGDGNRLRQGRAPRQQRLSDAFGAAHNGVRALGQPQHLPRARPGVALARVVLDVHEMRHMGQQAGVAPPEVLAETMGHENVGLESLADLHQLHHGGDVRPARDQLDRNAFRHQRIDARLVGMRLAAQHQQGLELVTRQMSAHQIERHLRRARKSTRDKVQNPRPPRRADCGIRRGGCTRRI